MTARRFPRIATLLAAVLVLAWLGASPAFAGPPEGASNADPKPDGMTPGQFEDWLTEAGPAKAVLIWSRVAAILLGILFLVQEILRRDRIRGGAAPPTMPWGTTVPFPGVQGLLLALVGVFGFQLVVAILVVAADLHVENTLEFRIGVTALSFLPVAALVVLRRRRLAGPRPGGGLEVRVARAFEVVLPPAPGLPIAPAPRAMWEGLRAYCLASLFIIPIGLLWIYLMDSLGAKPEVQTLVDDLAHPAHPWHPVLVAVFGIVVAPFTEEAVFRGLLYPTIREMTGGGRRGRWIGAVIVSALFAAIHQSLFAFPLLFCLAMLLTWVFERTNSLLACYVCHALNNGLSLLPVLVRIGS